MPIAAVINGATYAVHSDHLNTPRRLSNDSGQAVWQWSYSAFGEEKPTTAKNRFANLDITQNPGTTNLSAVKFNLRYPGQYADEESGLFYNYFRSYDARTGRYSQPDPIGLGGGWNRFGYVRANPLGDVDPLGLCGKDSSSCMSEANNPWKTNPQYHEYETDMIVCRLSATCTRDSVFKAVKEFPTPAGPVPGGVNSCGVSDIGGNKVEHFVDEENYGVFNIAMPGHMFEPGYVFRNVFVDANGNVILRTYGEGTGGWRGFNNWFGKHGWPLVDQRIPKALGR